VLYGAFIGGPGGAVDALLGAGAAFALLLAPYAIGALGAGDVKAAMALGAGFGAAAVSEQLLLAIVIGGVFAAGRLAASGELGAYLRRWAHMLVTTLVSRRLTYMAPAPGTAATRGLPFAVALALSVTAQMLLEIRV
jgi:prepilin peptidase CpaA